MDKDTFDDPRRLECRGIKFDPSGRILARPFHKFFNLGERPELQPSEIDMRQPHTIMEKLDGSMIHPAVVHDRLVLMTRMGRTNVARHAEGLLTERLSGICRQLLEAGITPIFEFTAPVNRVIISYETPELHLLALRETVSGVYGSYAEVQTQAAAMSVLPVSVIQSEWLSAHEFSRFARGLFGGKDSLLRFDDGLLAEGQG